MDPDQLASESAVKPGKNIKRPVKCCKSANYLSVLVRIILYLSMNVMRTKKTSDQPWSSHAWVPSELSQSKRLLSSENSTFIWLENPDFQLEYVQFNGSYAA